MEINDVVIHDIGHNKLKSGKFVTILRETDPLLRRFGQFDLLMLDAGEDITFYREKADEIWAVVDGHVAVKVEDTRRDSPSYQKQQNEELKGEIPRLIMVPFGVKCVINAELPSTLVRLTTHQDDTHPGDQTPLSPFD
jgi:dTDP-4-dehydrorhamnose 3,5-epimerase-like enzyme